MKRCPKCEFLYENEQNRCDMDGSELRSTGFLPPLPLPQPNPKARLKSIWGGLTIPLLALVMVATVLVILYRATPPTFSSSTPVTEQTEPPTTGNAQPPGSDDSPQLVTAPANQTESPEPSALQANRKQDNAAKSNRPGQPNNEKTLTAPAVLHIQTEPVSSMVSVPPPKTNQTAPAPSTSPKQAGTSYTVSSHPEPHPATPASQTKTPNQDKDSKVKSLFKKAGRILKKPF